MQAQGPFDRANPFQREISKQVVTATVCPPCLALEYGSKAKVTEYLDALDLLLLAGADDVQVGPLRCGEAGHQQLEVPLTVVRAMRQDPLLQQWLHQLDPKLEAPIGRYREERRVANQDVVAEVGLQFGPDFVEDRSGAATSRTGVESRRGSAKGENGDEPIAQTIARIPVAHRNKRIGKLQHHLTYLSGLPVAATVFEVKLPEEMTRDDFKAKVREMGSLRDTVAGIVMSYYFDLFAHQPAVQLIREGRERGEEVLRMGGVLNFPEVEHDERVRISGDLAVLQFRLHRQTPIHPQVTTNGDLVEALIKTGYPRLPRGAHKDGRDDLDGVFRAIAADLDWVYMVIADWQPVFDAMKFPRGAKTTT